MRDIIPNRYSQVEVKDINLLAQSDASLLIEQSEQYYEQQIQNIVNALLTSKKETKVVLLAGPSASAKTTTAHRLKSTLIRAGYRSGVVSLDNFYLPIHDIPRDAEGTPDFETIYSLDIQLIDKCIYDLTHQGKSFFPLYNFKTKERISRGHEITLGEKDIVVIEGLHAVNPLLTQKTGVDNVFTIYASARTKFIAKNQVLLEPKELRLMRRLVRDSFSRATSPEETISMWTKVCEGERAYINPYRDSVDYKIDTTLDYEPCIFHNYLLPFLISGEKEHIHRGMLEELYEKLRAFYDINEPPAIPENSIIHEFVPKI